MNAQIAKREMDFLLPPTNTSRGGGTARRPGDSRPTGLVGLIRRAIAWLREMAQREAVMEELSALSDRELADIGLTRGQIPSVFDPAFAAEVVAPRGLFNPAGAGRKG